ncbi:MAG: Uma2 family endonuclease [Chthoniobacteraceae bacterium]
MTAAAEILEIPEVRARISPFTVEQYHQFPEFNENGKRTELIRGVVIEKMSKSPLHASIVSALYDLLRPQVPSELWLRQEQPLTLRDSEPEPDISLVRGRRETFATCHPTTAALVIEIAVSSAAEDRSLASLYAEAGAEEYWIVLPTQRRVEVYRGIETGAYRSRSIVEGDATVECTAVPGVRVALGDLFGK